MVSVIICSRSNRFLPQIKTNIKETIGVEYELIIIDNSKNHYTISEAYNEGIKQSDGNIMCFLHEDILIHTSQWGQKLLDLFKKEKTLGIVGIAGSKMKTKTPSAWWDCSEDYRAANILQHLGDGRKEQWNYGFQDNEEEVVCIDGVFMAARKDSNIRFNEKLKGFHNYDLSLSIEYIKKGYKIIATNQILVEHFSMGKLDQSWYRSSIEFYKHYKEDLPLNTQHIPNDVVSRQEFSNALLFINELLKRGMRKEALKIWINLLLIKPISRKHFSIFKSFIK